jgi:A/G-specific adenine glycosylase
VTRRREHRPGVSLAPERIAALQERLLSWYAANRRDLPWRRTTDPYAILVSEVMLQQTQVTRVIPTYATWLRTWPRLEDLSAAPLADVLRAWQGLGYNNRARRLQECARTVCGSAHPGLAALPHTPAELNRLPGIGTYTARAVVVFAHNADVAAVDTNVRRVLTSELDLPEDLPASSLQEVAEAVLPRGRSRDWHNALMDYGALVLTARAAGLRPARPQGAFAGSRRERRARLLRLILAEGPLAHDELACRLDLPPDEVAALVVLLVRDGLLDDGPDGVAAP